MSTAILFLLGVGVIFLSVYTKAMSDTFRIVLLVAGTILFLASLYVAIDTVAKHNASYTNTCKSKGGHVVSDRATLRCIKPNSYITW